jgi:hypothetical protein
MARIVNTDNFGRDYPDERFFLWPMREDIAKRIADAMNDDAGPHAERFYKVVPNDYELVPGFEP